jgi:galactokinase
VAVVASAMGCFARHFGRRPAVMASAPGRVNLIGEHTDYNQGLVLPAAIPQRVAVALAPREDDQARAVSADLPVETAGDGWLLGAEARGRGWLDYVQGLTWTLRAAGHAVRGFEAAVASTVPIGSGLSSSAALQVAGLRALRAAFALDLDDVALALLAQRAESEFVGARVGVMDQMAASLAAEGVALFLDTQSLAFDRIPLPAGADLVVVDSGVAHAHATGGYNARRAECERAAALLGVSSLREIAVADLPRLEALPVPLGRRVRHVVTENARVLTAVGALRAGDVAALGRLFTASHESQRDDYEVSIPEIDALVAAADGDSDVFGARLTGGGFGGAVVILARPGRAAAVGARVRDRYAARTGRTATVLLPAGPSR